MYGKHNQYDKQNHGFDNEDRLFKQMKSIKAQNFKNYFNEKGELAKNSIKDVETKRTLRHFKKNLEP